MSRWNKNWTLFAFCFLGLFICIGKPLWGAAPDILQEANESYVEGERAETIAKRKEAFNRALALYTQAETVFQPGYSNGKIYYDIANTYFQLGEYPWAILYYYRALKLRPGDEKVLRNLTITLEKIGMPPPKEASIFQNIFFWHHSFSLPERLQLWFGVSVLLIAAISGYFWKRTRAWKQVIWAVAVVWMLLLLSLGYTKYFSDIEGVVVKSTMLYRGAGLEYAVVMEQPVQSGTKVKVVEMLQDGQWLKVIPPNGQVGYIPNSDLRII